MEQKNKREEMINNIIEELIKARSGRTDEDTIVKTDEALSETVGTAVDERTAKQIANVMELQKNTKLFKEMLDLSEALIKTFEFAKEIEMEISSVSMSEMLTGILIVLEEKGYIDIAGR